MKLGLKRAQKKSRCIIFIAWGRNFLQQVSFCIGNSKFISDYDLILITDYDTDTDEYSHLFSCIIQVDFQMDGLLRKTEAFQNIPKNYRTCLVLDSDTLILKDISYGFEVAEEHLISVSPAPHYSLDYFWGFDGIMKQEGIKCDGQLQYNTGVIFFRNCRKVRQIFRLWRDLALRYKDQYTNDQPFFTLAMLLLGFNPHTLSISYNYRGFGDSISGVVRIWHSHGKVPEDINVFDKPWPPRRAWPSKVERPG